MDSVNIYIQVVEVMLSSKITVESLLDAKKLPHSSNIHGISANFLYKHGVGVDYQDPSDMMYTIKHGILSFEEESPPQDPLYF